MVVTHRTEIVAGLRDVLGVALALALFALVAWTAFSGPGHPQSFITRQPLMIVPGGHHVVPVALPAKKLVPRSS